MKLELKNDGLHLTDSSFAKEFTNRAGKKERTTSERVFAYPSIKCFKIWRGEKGPGKKIRLKVQWFPGTVDRRADPNYLHDTEVYEVDYAEARLGTFVTWWNQKMKQPETRP